VHRPPKTLAGNVLTHVAAQVQTGTEDHLRQAHAVLNGLFPERMTPAHVAQAREWLRNPVQFEPMAFALTRQSAAVPTLYFGTCAANSWASRTRRTGAHVAVRPAGGAGRSVYQARQPGDRSRLLRSDKANFEPRLSHWYSSAMTAKDRVFSPVQVSVERKQLMVSLSQPVYDADGGAAGVFGTDLYLKPLADVLRTQRISSRGAAFVVDEKGALVASSAGDALFEPVDRQVRRRSPRDSANPVIRAASPPWRRCGPAAVPTRWPATRHCSACPMNAARC
jgi:hypothetical protein